MVNQNNNRKSTAQDTSKFLSPIPNNQSMPSEVFGSGEPPSRMLTDNFQKIEAI